MLLFVLSGASSGGPPAPTGSTYNRRRRAIGALVYSGYIRSVLLLLGLLK